MLIKHLKKEKPTSPSALAQSLSAICSGFAASLFIIIILALPFAIILKYTNLPAGWISPVSLGIGAFALLAGGFLAAKKAPGRALFHGLAIAIIFIIIMISYTGFASINLADLIIKCLAAIFISVAATILATK